MKLIPGIKNFKNNKVVSRTRGGELDVERKFRKKLKNVNEKSKFC
jgi:hypothetical protein